MVNSAQKWVRNIIAAAFGAALAVTGVSLAAPANAAVTANVVFGGFNDPSGQGCTNGLLATGHISPGEQIVLPGYPAHMEPWIDGGMAGSTAKGLPGGVEAVNRLLAEGKRVELHGCSQGTDVVIAVSHQVDDRVVEVIHGSPHAANGIFHADLAQGGLEPILQNLGGLPTDRIPEPGTHAFYNEGDAYANAVPNQYDIGAIVAAVSDTLGGDGHWVQPLFGQKCGFTDSFRVINHVYDDGNPVTKNGC